MCSSRTTGCLSGSCLAFHVSSRVIQRCGLELRPPELRRGPAGTLRAPSDPRLAGPGATGPCRLRPGSGTFVKYRDPPIPARSRTWHLSGLRWRWRPGTVLRWSAGHCCRRRRFAPFTWGRGRYPALLGSGSTDMALRGGWPPSVRATATIRAMHSSLSVAQARVLVPVGL
jgi:hypothetical protein